MYEDTWYSFVPDLRSKQEDSLSSTTKHHRRESLLKQPNEEHENLGSRERVPENSRRFFSASNNPPNVRVVRKVRSSNDLYTPLERRCSKGHWSRDSLNEPCTNDHKAGFVDFDELYESFEEDLLNATHEEYQLYRDKLALSERHLDNLLKDTTSTLDLLSTLSASFKAVESQTSAFQARCEDLVVEQKRIRSLANEIGTDLQYYEYLEPLTRRLNAPGAGRLTRNEDFLKMLENVNNCIVFMASNPSYRDSASYKTRYTSLLERALNLVQTAFTTALHEVADDVFKELNSREHNETTEYILLYGKFETAKEKLGSTIDRMLTTEDFAYGREEDQKNANAYGSQYHHLFTSLLDAYVKSREPVAPLVLKRLRTFAPKHTTLSEAEFKAFARLCIQLVFDFCNNEIKLVEKYFKGGPLMTEYSRDKWDYKISTNYLKRLEQICLSHTITLHSFLTPYLNKGDLHRLCDLVNWLETTYMGTTDGAESIEQEGHILAAQALLSNHLWPLLDQQFIKSVAEFEHFKPSTEDLKVTSTPPITSAHQSNTVHKRSVSRDQSDANQSTANGLGVANAYPTVKNAVNLLIMYNDSIFDRIEKGDVLYEIVHATTLSLQKAATTIKRSSTTMDAQMFLIKNLMLIENLFLIHEIPDSVRQSSELDFSPIWNTIKELQNRKQVMNPLAYIRPLVKGNLMPAVRDQLLDARKELEKVLVQQITGFTKVWKERLATATRGKKSNVTPAEELEALLKSVFEDETTRAALLRMIHSGQAT